MAEPRRFRSILERPWTAEDASELYQIDAWGRGYFAVSARGHLLVRPEKSERREVDLYELVGELARRGLEAPLLVRFSNILSDRLREMHGAFSAAMAENEYRGGYLAVYPIKVNQQRPVVEELYRYGGEFGCGLEVGSKPELLAVMALAAESRDRLVVCNGFKDDGYAEAVIWAAKLGMPIVPVVENFDELERILGHAARHDVRPRLGVRLKLASHGAGRWRQSSGARSKFGLFVSEVLELVAELERRGMGDCLELVHCHAGSQLHDIRRVKDAVGELAHVYADLVRLGASGLRYLDVGGGLGVDYDGSQTNFPSSMNYSVGEYANEVVYRVASVCAEKEVEPPVIVTESGRSLAAFQSVLVFDVLGRTGLDRFEIAEDLDAVAEEDEAAQPILDLIEAHRDLSERRVVECYHDALQAYEQAIDLFNLGYLSLEWRGLAERLYWSTCARIRDLTRRMPAVPDELAGLETVLADTYFCNLSIFQSLPDAWAIGQIFPVAPIHRLDRQPTRKAVLADITCDSDGRIDRFVGARDIKRTLPLHDLEVGEKYYLAAFLVGAYQETLGDLHNLFGDPHVVHVHVDEAGAWRAEEVVEGDSAAEVLSYVQYDADGLRRGVEAAAGRAVAEGRMTAAAAGELAGFYERQLDAYTYLESRE